MRLLILLILACFIQPYLAVAQNPLFETIRVFDSKEDGYASTRDPALCLTKQGTLLAFCEARFDNPKDWASIDLLMRRSTDGGKTWNKAVIISRWMDESEPAENKPVGYILSLEGADSLIDLSYVERAYGYGLRAIGPGHYSTGRYAPGTGLSGPLTSLGRDLLREMDRLGMVLDITHLTDEGFDEALSLYNGPIWASHHNCRALVPHQRQLTDDQIRVLIERGAIIGGCFDAWMMRPGFTQRVSNPADFGITIATIVEHYDHICQLAGNALHCAIGSDLDGTYGREQSPTDLDTIADLQSLRGALSGRGYSEADITNIFHGNALRFLRAALP
ncbi:MAG: membrane dipeptidase [Rudanella sp.]|nr:membrane dipeptidase [Rudanella sp.]